MRDLFFNVDGRRARTLGLHRQLDRRLDSIEKRIDSVERTVAAGFAEVNRRIDTLTRWLIGMQIASLIALGTLILTRLPG